METNPYEYDRTVPWIPQQQQRPVGTQFTAPNRAPKPKSAERMPKARALALARTLKKSLVIASFVSFGTLSGLVAFHQVGTTTSNNSQTNQSSSKSSQATATATPSSSNGFFDQQGGNNLGSSSSSQGSTSGSSNSSQGSTSTSTSGSSNSSQSPVSGSGVS